MRHEIRPPVWSGRVGCRVLIEASDWAKQDSLSRLLQQAGYQTATCDGPEGTNSRCPLVAHGTCDACHHSDVVIHAFRHSDPRNREVLMNLRSRFPDTPIIVEVPAPRAERYPADFEGCSVISQPMTAESLLDAIVEALDPPMIES